MGTGLSDSGNAGRIPRASLIPRYRLRLAHARRLGLATSPDSTSHLALCAEVFAGMRGL